MNTALHFPAGVIVSIATCKHVDHCASKGRYVFSWVGRAGASEGRVISESEHQKGRAIPHVSYSREGHTSFPEFFNENFCDVAFHFSYRLSFSFHLL